MKNKIIIVLSVICCLLILWLSYEIPDNHNTSIEIDSTYTKEVDTLYVRDTITVDSIYIPPADTVYADSTTKEDNKYSYFRNYTTTYTDTLLDATIKTTVQGFLVNQKLQYTPNYPIEINTTIKNRVTRTIKKYPESHGSPMLTTGITTNGIQTGVHIGGGWRFKNNNMLTYTYDPILKNHSISYIYNLRNLFK